jgi:hypothetical protein
MRKILLQFFLLTSVLQFAQSDINLSDYKNYLSNNENLTFEQLFNSHNTGVFKKNINSQWQNSLYADSVDIKYQLTEDEKFLLSENGFVVTERLSHSSFPIQLVDIFHKDLPVFVTTDAILHTVHRSYDAILKDIELELLIPKLKELLKELKDNIKSFSSVKNNIEIQDRLKDLDIYLSVPLKILDNSQFPAYSENYSTVNEFIQLVNNAEYEEKNFFSSTLRKIDFSQFKPRGHYVDEYYPQLADYFKAMMWLGKMELYLIAPNSINKPTNADVQRQILISVLMKELIDFTNASNQVNEIENIIQMFVGDQDNVTIDQIEEVLTLANLSGSSDLLDTNNVKLFQEELANQPYVNQKILSQVLIVDPMNPESLKPASSFMLFGQRFVIDSYVTASVVYDQIIYENQKIKRMLPSTLDILFALGNDASIQLLENELNEYKYSSNLAALRYQVDSFEAEFWDKSIYNNWLNAIRQLNPDKDRTMLPAFMQTAAWWQQKMNTQLASWTELRHDNLLYAKQSYTGGAVCSYPHSYVEPFPEFFESLKRLAVSAKSKIGMITFNHDYMKTQILRYYDNLYNISDTLKTIAVKELNNELLTEEEKNFLKSMVSEAFSCVPAYDGWYMSLFYPYYEHASSGAPDYLVADYHTTPTDEGGTMVGWVKHAGTGDVDLAIITAEIPGGEHVTFVGPVSSYHEYTSTNFYRLTDQEWQETYLNSSTRPDWVNIFLANEDGNLLSEGPSLITSVNSSNSNNAHPSDYLIAQNYPNPFNPSTIISFNISTNYSNQNVKLIVYNTMGEEIKLLLNRKLPSGNYKTKWLGNNNRGLRVNSGIYIYKLQVGEHQFIGKMNLIK